MSAKSILPACAAALAALAAGACGEGPDHGDPRSVVDAFTRAALEHDARAACDLITPHGRQVVRSQWPASDCEQAFAFALRQTSRDEFEQMRKAKIKKIEVAGDTALITPVDPDRPVGVLRRINGRSLVEVTPR